MISGLDLERVVSNLNAKLVANNLETEFYFMYSSNGDSFNIKLCEVSDFGYEIILFDDDSAFSPFIKDNIDRDYISYKEAIIMQTTHNFPGIVNRLTEVREALYE